MSFFIWTRKTRRNNQRNTEISLLFRDPSLTNCPPTTDPWAGHTVLSQGGPYCPPFLKTGKAPSKQDFSWKGHLVSLNVVCILSCWKRGILSFFLEWTTNPDLKPWKKKHEGREPGPPFISYRGKRFGVSWWRCGVESEPKLWWFHHQFLKCTSQKTNMKPKKLLVFSVAFFRFHVGFPGCNLVL